MLPSFVFITPCLRTQNLIRKRNSLREQGSINLSTRPFSTLRDGYNFLLASSLLSRRASSLLSLITSCTLKVATDYCSQNMCFFKNSSCCQMCSTRLLAKNSYLLRAFGMQNHLETKHL